MIRVGVRYVRFCLLILILWTITQVQASVLNSHDLIDHHGKNFQLDTLGGQVVLIFFGYTSCPDVCPLELSLMASVLNEFADRQLPVRGLFVSVDPERDTPQVLRDYTSHFSETLTGLTGSKQQIRQFANRFNAYFNVIGANDTVVKVDHSANLYILDKAGSLYSVVPFGMTRDHIKRVVEHLLITKK